MDDISALRGATGSVLGQDAALFEVGKPATRWLRVARGGYGRGDLFFKGENPPYGALFNFYVKAKPAELGTLEVFDATGGLKTTYILDAAEAGINRVAWDLRFDPPAATVQNLAGNLRKQIDGGLQSAVLKEDQKAVLRAALAELEKFGTNFSKVMEIQQRVLPILRGSGLMAMFGGGGGFGGFGGRGMMGGQAAEPGTYAVKLTFGGKTYSGKVAVRLDPLQAAAGN
jgi:hypothetical protein